MGRKTHLIVEFDHDTSVVSLQVTGVPICLAQMMVDEARRQLDIERRAAASMELRQQMADAALAASLTGGARHRG